MGLKEDLKQVITELDKELSVAVEGLGLIERTEKQAALYAAQKSYIKLLEKEQQYKKAA